MWTHTVHIHLEGASLFHVHWNSDHSTLCDFYFIMLALIFHLYGFSRDLCFFFIIIRVSKMQCKFGSISIVIYVCGASWENSFTGKFHLPWKELRLVKIIRPKLLWGAYAVSMLFCCFIDNIISYSCRVQVKKWNQSTHIHAQSTLFWQMELMFIRFLYPPLAKILSNFFSLLFSFPFSA